MSRVIAFAALGMFAGLSQQVAAQVVCSVGTAVLPAVMLTEKTVCAVLGSDRWQEYHKTGGDLIDYKKGPTDTVDPSKKVGTWSVNDGLVTYTYGSSAYTYRMCDTGGGTYRFEPAPTGSLVTGATLISGLAQCP